MFEQLAVHVDPGLADDGGPDVGAPGRPLQGRPPLTLLVVLALRALAELADAALHRGLDGREDGGQGRVDLLVLLHRGEEGAVVQVLGDAEVGEGVDVRVLEPVVPRVQVRAGLAAQVRLDRLHVGAELLGVGHGVRLIPGRARRTGAVRCERRGQARVQLDAAQVDRSRAGDLRVELRGAEVVRCGQADDQAGAAARKAVLRSRPTAKGSMHSSSDSASTGRTHWYASSLRNPPVQPD